MRSQVVIGANFGDEGKGLFTDYLCAKGADMVVRFNGGAQAGHTVVTPSGKRHVHSHFGSGTLQGVPTFLSQFFICNPILFMDELLRLKALGLPQRPIVYAHPKCRITTFADMMINQRKEDAKGDKRHGSVGVGINETVNRSEIPELEIIMSDLWNNVDLTPKLVEICGKYAAFRTGKQIENPDAMIEGFKGICAKFADLVHPLGMSQLSGKHVVFEGAQGLLLSQDNKEYFPHLTRSYTGMRNVRQLLSQVTNAAEPEIFYISRTYLTRHGAGRLPGEDASMSFEDQTNVNHPYQGPLRFAPLDYDALLKRCNDDAGGSFSLVLTHYDQFAAPGRATFYSGGPTRDDIEEDQYPSAIYA